VKNSLLKNWYKFALIIVPLVILIISTTSAIIDWRQPDSQKALRLVRESKSRKENFTVQQYLYATVYYRKDNGEPITINGWDVETLTASQFLISFTYTDGGVEHCARWETNLKEKKVTPKNQDSIDLSWQ
jgi:hypothetical protein